MENLAYDIRAILPLKSPRLDLDVSGWPMANKRGLAQFRVQTDPRGHHYVLRSLGDSKRTSPSAKYVYIVQGTNGKVYIVGYRPSSESAFILHGSMKRPQFVSESENPEMFRAIRNLCLAMNNPASMEY